MVYAILQIKSGSKVLKPWLGKRVSDDASLLEIYNAFASGLLDNSECIASEYNSTKVKMILFLYAYTLHVYRISSKERPGRSFIFRVFLAPSVM